jgi:hypothetical protein
MYSIYISICLWLYGPLLGLGSFFSFLIFYTDGRTPWTGDEPVSRPLPAHRTTQTQNKRTQTTMPQAGFEPTIPVFERAKTVHALDCAATGMGLCMYTRLLSMGCTQYKLLYMNNVRTTLIRDNPQRSLMLISHEHVF